jgi:hypothetical protein
MSLTRRESLRLFGGGLAAATLWRGVIDRRNRAAS